MAKATTIFSGHRVDSTAEADDDGDDDGVVVVVDDDEEERVVDGPALVCDAVSVAVASAAVPVVVAMVAVDTF